MASYLEVDEVIEMRLQGISVHAMEVAHETHQLAARLGDVLAGGIDLGAIAGRNHHGLAHGFAGGERAQRRRYAAHLEVQTLPQFNGRRSVANAYQEEMHLNLV